MSLQEFKNKMAKDLFDQAISEALEQQICINCKDPALPKCHSEAGIEDYVRSGLCEECFDEICGC